MSCQPIYITINPTETVNISLESSSDVSTIFAQTIHTVEDASITEITLDNGQSFKSGSLLVFRNGAFLGPDNYEVLTGNTGINVLIELDDTEGDEDEIVLFYAVA